MFDHNPVVSTMRKRASFRIILSKASAARSSGMISMVGRTPLSALKASVSWEGYNSMDIPEWMQENCKLLVLTSSFKGENTTMSFPLNCNVVRAAFGLPLQPERKK